MDKEVVQCGRRDLQIEEEEVIKQARAGPHEGSEAVSSNAAPRIGLRALEAIGQTG